MDGAHDAWSSPGFLLWHATLRWQREMTAALKPLGLTHVQFVLLGSTWWLEREQGAPRQRDIVEHAGTDPMMTSQVLRTLESRGLVARSTDPDDGRVWRVRTTGAGRTLAERAVAAAEDVDRSFFRAGADVTALRHLAGRDAVGDPAGRP